MSTENYLRELRWKEINALRAEVEDWKDNYNKATDACVALRAENARLRERLRFDDEEPYAHIDSLQSENAKLRAALRNIADPNTDYEAGIEIARAALQKDEGE